MEECKEKLEKLTEKYGEEKLIELMKTNEFRNYRVLYYLRTKFLKWVIMWTIVFAVCYVYYTNEEMKFSIIRPLRFIIVRYIYPLTGFNGIDEDACIVDNPFYTGGLSLDQCSACGKVKFEDISVLDISNETETSMKDGTSIQSNVFLKRYVGNRAPVIVTGHANVIKRDWPLYQNVTNIKDLHELIDSDPVLKKSPSCFMNNSMDLILPNHRYVMNYFIKEKISNYWLQWQNCPRLYYRLFRAFFKRPIFVPGSVAMNSVNGIFVSDGYIDSDFTMIASWVGLIVQVRGRSEVRLDLHESCIEVLHEIEGLQFMKEADDKCFHQVKGVLNEGDSLFIPANLWTAYVRPLVEPPKQFDFNLVLLAPLDST